MKSSILFLLLIFLCYSLSAQFTVNCYSVLDSNISNPDRGFTMYYLSGTSANTVLLRDYPANSPEKVINKLKENKYSLVAFIAILKDYKTAAISQGYLDTLALNLQTVRDSGLKCILQFYYDIGGATSFEPGLTKILADIAALKPVIGQYQDVIYTLKQGFIGPWGEEWTSTNLQFGGIYLNNGQPMISQANYADRKTILDAVLGMFTDNKIICVRQPLLKLNMFGKCYADSITASTAYGADSYYRVGYYNDGFLASSDDLGTWQWGMPMIDKYAQSLPIIKT